MSVLCPPPLNIGDTIGIFAPSSWIDSDKLVHGVTQIEQSGFKVKIHPQTLLRLGQSAGTDDDKLSALYDLWADPTVTAIWAAGGGNRALRLLDKIDYTKLSNPKILIGYSDVTALLNAVFAHTGIITFHGPTISKLTHAAPIFKRLCRMKEFSYPVSECEIWAKGEASGPIIGGNLSIFHYISGTTDCPNLNDAILYLEDCNEEISRIDRMFTHLKRMGVLDQISGLVLGNFTDLSDSGKPFGFSLRDIVKDATQERNIPILANAPFGHGKRNITFPIGAIGNLSAQDGKSPILEVRFCS